MTIKLYKLIIKSRFLYFVPKTHICWWEGLVSLGKMIRPIWASRCWTFASHAGSGWRKTHRFRWEVEKHQEGNGKPTPCLASFLVSRLLPGWKELNFTVNLLNLLVGKQPRRGNGSAKVTQLRMVSHVARLLTHDHCPAYFYTLPVAQSQNSSQQSQSMVWEPA